MPSARNGSLVNTSASRAVSRMAYAATVRNSMANAWISGRSSSRRTSMNRKATGERASPGREGWRGAVRGVVFACRGPPAVLPSDDDDDHEPQGDEHEVRDSECRRRKREARSHPDEPRGE